MTTHMRRAAIWIRFNRRRPKRKIDRAGQRYSATSSSTALLMGRSPWPGCLLLYRKGISQDEKDCRVLYPYATMFVSDPDDLIGPMHSGDISAQEQRFIDYPVRTVTTKSAELVWH